MEQLSFLLSTSTPVVNVASVPQRSPFRYPGGKTWLVPQVRHWLSRQPMQPGLLVEPFAGGGIISLTAAFEHLAEQVLMVEIDEHVAAVWQTVLDGDDAVWLAQRIVTFDLTTEQLEAVFALPVTSVREQAFRTILKNRVNRGGIMAAGAGKIKQGENGKGLRSRWYPETLQRRILNILAVRERIEFRQGDGIQVLAHYAHRPDAVFFIDPPYTAAGKKAGMRLYAHADLDHAALFQRASTLKGDFLMTYDDTAEIRDLAHAHGFDLELVAMKNTHHARMHELLIGPCLDWIRR